MTTPQFSGLARQGIPFVYFTNFVAPTSPTSTLTINAGDVWIRASDIVSTTGTDQFIGLRVNGGTITVVGANILSYSPYFEVANDTVEAVFSVNNDETSSSTSPQGTDTTRPKSATFLLKAGSTQLVAADAAVQTVLGYTANLTYAQTPATIKTSPNLVIFPFQPDESSYTITSGALASYTLSGTAVCSGAGWGFPSKAPLTNGVLAPVGESGFLVLYFGKGLQFLPTVIPNLGTSSIISQCSVLSTNDAFEILGAMPFSVYKLPLPNKGSLSTLASTADVNFTLVNSQTLGIVVVNVGFQAAINEPRSVNNQRLNFTMPTGSLRFGASSTNGIIDVRASGTSPAVSKLAWSFAIKNYFTMCEAPTSASITASFPAAVSASPQTAWDNVNGSASITMPIVYGFPTLPDPYTSNAVPYSERRSTSDSLNITVDWSQPQTPKLGFNLPTDVLQSVQWQQPSDATEPFGPIQASDQQLLTALNNTYFSEQENALSLLDLSSSGGQFGVDFSNTNQIATSVSDLLLQAPNSSVRSIALSTVSWEPVITTPAPANFPGVYQFPYDGPTTRFSTQAATVVPITPMDVLDSIQGSYNSDNEEFRARFNLPFGMVAYASLTKPKLHFEPATILQYNMPTFSAAGISGTPQLSIIPRQTVLVQNPTRSAAIRGNAVMLKFNESGQNAPISILGNTAHDINNDFGPNGTLPQVPLTRVDLSGYGESMSSDWFDLNVTPPATERVDFDVYNGRTERTLIQQVYEIVHIGAKCIRTITMQRQNNGLVYRTNVLSAGSDGLYQFHNTAIVTHPGIFPKYTNIRNIRDTGNPPIQIGTTQLSSILYDSDVTVSIVGSLSVKTSALNHQGFIIINDDISNPFGPSQYAQLLQQYGSQIGGPINCTVKLASLTLKLSSISVDSSTPSTANANPEFVVAANHTVEFEGSGEWSFLSVPIQASATVVGDQGIPLIREGAASAGAATTPYRWADPSDLYDASPSIDYGLLHSGRNQRVLFARPKIEEDSLNQISSVVVPLIADPYALSLSSGPYPPLSLCIPFETLANATSIPSFRLNINAGGFISLSLPSDTFASPVTERSLLNTPDLTVTAYSPSSAVTLNIDSAAPQPYMFQVTNMALSVGTSSTGTISELYRATGDLVCLPKQQSQFNNSQFALGGPFDGLTSTADWLQKLGIIPPVQVSMTNDWSCWGSLDVDIDKLIYNISKVAGPAASGIGAFFKNFVPELDYKLSYKLSFTEAMTTATTYRLVVRIPHVILGADALLTAYVEIFSKTPSIDGVSEPSQVAVPSKADPSQSTTIEVGFGVGVGYSIAMVGVTAYAYGLVTGIVVINTTTNTLGWGIGILVKLHVELFEGAIGVDVTTEAKCFSIPVKCTKNVGGQVVPQQTTQWIVGQFTLDVDVHVAWVLNIDFAVQVQGSKNMNGGPCPLSAAGLGP